MLTETPCRCRTPGKQIKTSDGGGGGKISYRGGQVIKRHFGFLQLLIGVKTNRFRLAVLLVRYSKRLTVERHCCSNGPSTPPRPQSYFQDGLIEFAGTLPAAVGKSYAQSCRRSQYRKIASPRRRVVQILIFYFDQIFSNVPANDEKSTFSAGTAKPKAIGDFLKS